MARVHIASWRTTYSGLVPDDYIERRTQWDLRYPMWVERLTTARAAFVAEDADGVFGIACAQAMPERPNDWDPLPYDTYLDALYLIAGRQRRGAGRALLAAVAGDLLASGYRSMALHVISNSPSRGFYEHLGAVYLRDEEPEPGNVAFACAYGITDLARLVPTAP